MNIREKAEKALKEGRLEDGDAEMLTLMLEQHEKFPESNRIANAISEIIKRKRQSVTLDDDDIMRCQEAADILMGIFEDFYGLTIPTKKNRTHENVLNNLIESVKMHLRKDA